MTNAVVTIASIINPLMVCRICVLSLRCVNQRFVANMTRPKIVQPIHIRNACTVITVERSVVVVPPFLLMFTVNFPMLLCLTEMSGVVVCSAYIIGISVSNSN